MRTYSGSPESDSHSSKSTFPPWQNRRDLTTTGARYGARRNSLARVLTGSGAVMVRDIIIEIILDGASGSSADKGHSDHLTADTARAYSSTASSTVP